MSKYKAIQLTNTNIPVINAGEYLPLGTITRRINAPTSYDSTFQVTSSSSDMVYINEPGYYKITYSSTLTAGAAGLMSLTLDVNNVDTYTVSEEAMAAEDIVNVTLNYIVRVCPNSCASPYNCPVSIQIKLGDVATGITPNPSIGNLIIERIY
jgi:hypothetical protein